MAAWQFLLDENIDPKVATYLDKEGYDDVLERLLTASSARTADRDLLEGFGRWADERAERARETRESYEETSIERTRRRSEDG